MIRHQHILGIYVHFFKTFSRLKFIKFLCSSSNTWIKMAKRSNDELRGQVTSHKLTKSDFKTSNDLEIQGNASLLGSRPDYLPSPTKSLNDKKEYRTVRLENGLVALLISDVPNLILDLKSEAKKDVPCESDLSESDSDGSEEEEENVHLSEEDGGKSLAKKAQGEEKMAAVGLCIGVGSFSDPWEIPGMAHFLEHMVFMGSKKFPKENDFDSFIKKHGGSDNAGTECEFTTFYFEAPEIHLFEAMDKFAQFFIAPLMKREAMTRERESIESEFQMSLPSHFNRKQQLLSSLARDKHPVSKFTWGNLKTLQENIKDDVLHKAVHEFRNRHYSGHRMTLAVQARLPLSTLEEWVRKCFSDVPNNGLPPDDFRDYAGMAFDTPAFRRLYRMDPIKDLCQVELTWAMPSMVHLYRCKPLHYLRHVLAHEGKGSLLSYLRKNVWALEIFSGDESEGFDHNSMHSLLHLTLVLTDSGYKNLSKVLEAVFSYIRMLQRVGPCERLFNELKIIEETSFRFTEEISAAEYVEELAEDMQFFPPEDYITGSRLFFHYDAEAIQACLNILKPDDVNIIVSAKNANIEYDKVEPWFGTSYTDSDIPAEWLECWKSVEPYPDFSLPEPNIFLTEDFTLHAHTEPVPPYPVKIHADELSEVWYRPDEKFNLPIAYLKYCFISPLPLSSPLDTVMLDLFVLTLKQLLIEDVYLAEEAHLSSALYTYDRGFMLSIDGYNQKLHLLLQTMLKKLSTFEDHINEDLFCAIKEEQTKYYYNAFLKPSFLAKDVRFSAVLQTHWTAVDKQGAIKEVTLDKLKAFISKLREHLYIQSLVQGNYSKQEALDACRSIIQQLNCKPLLPHTFPELRVCQIPLGQTYCCVKSYNSKDSNSIVTNYYQCELITLKTSCIIELLMLLMDEPIYDTLRTKEQLGYNVYCLLRDTFGVAGFSITVNCQAGKHSTEFVDERIEAFVKTFSKKLKKMSEKDIQEIRQTLIKLKQIVDLHLKEEVKRNWDEIVSMEYVFDRLQREVEIIKCLKTQEIRKWLDDHIACGNKSKFKKLSTQVVGYSDQGNQEKKPDHKHTETSSKDSKLTESKQGNQDEKPREKSSSKNPKLSENKQGNQEKKPKLSEKSSSKDSKLYESQQDLLKAGTKPSDHAYFLYGSKTEFPLQMLNTNEPNHIANLEDFKRGLFLYPIHKNTS